MYEKSKLYVDKKNVMVYGIYQSFIVISWDIVCMSALELAYLNVLGRNFNQLIFSRAI